MKEISIYEFGADTTIRTAQGENGEPLVCAHDLAKAFKLKKPENKYSQIDNAHKVTTLSKGSGPDRVYLTEAGVYELIYTLRLRKDNEYYETIKAKRKWLFAEVLPAIRKTGTYSVNKAEVLPEPNNLAIYQPELESAIKIANLFGLTGNQAYLAANKCMKSMYKIDIMEECGIALPSPDQEVLLTPTEIGKRVGGISGQRVNLSLADAGFQSRIGGQWVMTAEGKKYGVLLDVGKKCGEGTPVQQLKWKASVIPFLQSA